jgi:hypothetical protein
MKTVGAPLCQHGFSLPTGPASVPRARAEAAKVFVEWGLTCDISAVDVGTPGPERAGDELRSTRPPLRSTRPPLT